MWISMKSQHVFVAIWLSSYLRAICFPCERETNKTIDWNLRVNESSRPVNNFQVSLNKTPGYNKTPRLGLVADGLRNNLTLFLFALPGIKNESLCPSDIGNNKDLRRHKWIYCIPGNESSPENFDINWNAIMTGCFYVVMRNEEGAYWQLEHRFYETNYTYVNTKLELFEKPTDKPQSEKSSRELRPVIKVPLRCIKLVTILYELEGKVPNDTVITKDWIYHKRGQDRQTCTIFYGRDQKTPRFTCIEKNTNLTIEADLIDEGNDTWTVKIIWKNLRYGGNTYYIGFLREPDMIAFNRIQYRDSWESVADPVILYKHYLDADNSPMIMVSTQGFPNIPQIIGILLCSLVGVFAIVRSVGESKVRSEYWKLKLKYLKPVVNTENGESEESGNTQTLGLISD